VARITTTHVGSLVRLPELAAFVRAREDHAQHGPRAHPSIQRAKLEALVKRAALAGARPWRAGA